MGTEHSIQNAILKELALHPEVMALRANCGSRSHKMKGFPRGVPDIIGYITVEHAYDGEEFAVYFGIEIKKPGEKATPEQTAFLGKLKYAGGYAGVATSVEEALKILKLEKA